jgi:hypothetical protein
MRIVTWRNEIHIHTSSKHCSPCRQPFFRIVVGDIDEGRWVWTWFPPATLGEPLALGDGSYPSRCRAF